MTHGTWYSRLTMPMCDCGVPDRHTTAANSSKIGARNVAPASATHATTPSAVESISASTSSGDDRRRHVPLHRRRPRTRGRRCPDRFRRRSRPESNPVRSGAVPPTRVFPTTDTPCCTKSASAASYQSTTVRDRALIATQLAAAGLLATVRESVRITTEGRALHDAWARVVAGTETEEAGDPRLRTVPAAERGVPPAVSRLAGPAGQRAQRPRRCPRTTGRSSIACARSTSAPRRSSAASRRALDRFDAYPRRLRAALEHVDNGEPEWFTSPRIDSYHTVWMMAHEDLLVALGRRREDEPDEVLATSLAAMARVLSQEAVRSLRRGTRRAR